MTDTSPARPYWQASQVADEFVKSIADCTERVLIAGSIRRKCAYVHDIDVLAISKIVTKSEAGWFGIETNQQSLLHTRIAMLVSAGVATPRVKKDGKTMVGELVAFLDFKGFPLDLYYGSEKTWWGLVQMRTGSAGFNRKLATIALSRGFRYHADGGGIADGLGQRIDDGTSEESIFRALNMRYVPPEDRNDEL